VARKSDELKVFIANRPVTCAECGEDLGRKAFIFLAGEKGAICLECADLDHLVFLRAGNAALTRRAKKYSKLWAVVLKWSRARKRYERQGLLVEEEAFDRAFEECEADEEIRAARRLRERERRSLRAQEHTQRFARRIRELFPGAPEGVEWTIAEIACEVGSGHVGRTAAGRALDDDAVRAAVVAHIRHAETPYDELLMTGWDRFEARDEVRARVQDVLERWQRG